VAPAFIPDATETPNWESVRSLCRTDRSGSVMEAGEFTYASVLIAPGAVKDCPGLALAVIIGRFGHGGPGSVVL
jgi:hypothetical protein